MGHYIYKLLMQVNYLINKVQTSFSFNFKVIEYFFNYFKVLNPFIAILRFITLFWAYFLLFYDQVCSIDVKMQPSILIVEDEKIVREGLARALSHEFKIYQASNGNEAMKIIYKHSDITVIVSDLKMPEIDGFKLLEKIRDENKNIKVIFLTAFYSIESAVDAMRKGAFDYICKPVNLKKLESTIKNAIQI